MASQVNSNNYLGRNHNKSLKAFSEDISRENSSYSLYNASIILILNPEKVIMRRKKYRPLDSTNIETNQHNML